jgi:hypothetical protein
MRAPPTRSLAFSIVSLVASGLGFGQDAYFEPILSGTIVDGRIRELSGMAPVSGAPGHFWVHNDSDDTPRLFAVEERGAVIAEVLVPGAAAVDWEDIARGPGPAAGETFLFIADTGDNDLARTELCVYRIVEPRLASLTPGQRLVSSPAACFRFQYPDGSRNNEALVVHPQTGGIYVITKDGAGAGVYRLPDPAAAGGLQTLIRVGAIFPGDLVTAADLSRDGERLLLRTYSEVQEYRLPAGRPFEEIFFQPRRVLPDAAAELKSESICFDHRDRDYLTTNEGNPAPIHRVRLKVPLPSCAPSPDDAAAFEFVRGDPSGDKASGAEISILDVTAILDLAVDAEDAPCADGADVDDDGLIEAADARLLFQHLVRGTRPPAPFPAAGRDATGDALGCRVRGRWPLVPRGAPWRYWRGAAAPDPSWRESDFADGDWPIGAAPMGAGGGDLATVLDGLIGAHASFFARAGFALEDLPPADGLFLQIDFNDGFVAFLNGVEAARSGLEGPGFEAAPDAFSRPRSGSGFLEVPLCRELLRPGWNVLALQVHNRSLADASLRFDAAIEARRADADAPPETEAPALPAAMLRFRASGPLAPGRPVHVDVVADCEASFRALSLSIAYTTRQLRILGVESGADLPTPGLEEARIDPFRGQIAYAALASAGAERRSYPGGADLRLLRLTVEAIAAAPAEARLAFVAREGAPALENLLVAEDGGPFAVDVEELEIEAASDGIPSIVDLIEASGVAGDVFYLVGDDLFAAPGLEVRVCERTADFVHLGDGATLRIIAPSCARGGYAPVEVRSAAGSSRVEEGFFYERAAALWIRGDANGDGRVDISDAVAVLGQLFSGRAASPACGAALDANADGRIDIADAVAILRFLFQGSTSMPPPFREPAPCEE